MKPLAPQPKAFAQAIAAGANSVQASRAAGYKANRLAASVNAHRRLKKAKIASRVAEQQAKAAKKAARTVEDLVANLDRAYEVAEKTANPENVT